MHCVLRHTHMLTHTPPTWQQDWVRGSSLARGLVSILLSVVFMDEGAIKLLHMLSSMSRTLCGGYMLQHVKSLLLLQVYNIRVLVQVSAALFPTPVIDYACRKATENGAKTVVTPATSDQMELVTPGFSLALTWLLKPPGEWDSRWCLPLPLCFSHK